MKTKCVRCDKKRLTDQLGLCTKCWKIYQVMMRETEKVLGAKR